VATYFDSSALLEILLGGARRRVVAVCWDADPVRLGSTLLEAEAITVLRRVAPRSAPPAGWLDALDRYLDAMIIRDVDREIVDLLRRTTSLGPCRSLDALHLATALLFQKHLDDPLRLCALDERMRRLAAAHGLAVVPDR
jgi:predicted nucleic acid-binding protein